MANQVEERTLQGPEIPYVQQSLQQKYSEAEKPTRRSSWSRTEIRLLLAAVDLGILGAALTYAGATRWQGEARIVSASTIFTGMVLTVVVWSLLSVCAGLYETRVALSTRRTLRALACAAITLFLLRPYFTPGSESQFYGVATAVVVSLAVWRLSFAHMFRFLRLEQRVLILGAGDHGRTLAECFQTELEDIDPSCHLAGFVDDDPLKVDENICGYRVLGTSKDLLSIARESGADEIVLAVSNPAHLHTDAVRSLLALREAGLAITSMPSFYEKVTRKIAVEHTGPSWGILFPLEESRASRTYELAARVCDIGFGIVGTIAAVAVAPMIMIANRVGNPGPLLYYQTRVGKGGRHYRIYKFRSMVPDAEKAGARWCTAEDPRITKIGNFLRKTRLDELPQFWNVLIGEMAFVGPRPERPEFVEMLERSVPFYQARHAVKPGLTGWAQVNYRYGASEEDALIKLRYDLYYIKHRSLQLDLRIFVKTFATVIGAKGR